jgi:ABC-type multidrug transport system fused ATPase/permease subunit
LKERAKEDRLRAFQRQIELLQHRLETLSQVSYRLSWLRAAIFFAGLLALVGLIFYVGGGWLFWLTLLALVLLFGGVVYYHRRIERGILNYQTWQQIKLNQIARMTLDWANIPISVQYQPRFEHPFEADLDLVGGRSLHHLLDTAVSIEGSQLLKAWLTNPDPDLHEIARRQQLVRELIPLFLFRHKLIHNTMISAGARKMWDARRLLHWLEQTPPAGALRFWLFLLGPFAGLNISLFLLNQVGSAPPIWPTTFGLYFGLVLLASRGAVSAFHEALALQAVLKQLEAVFQQLERFSYRNTPQLKQLCAPFLDPANRPAGHLNRINWIVTATGLRGNPFVWFILNAIMPWDLYFAYRLHQCKTTMAGQAPVWLNTWFELEALSSLANLAYLNPDYSLPQILREAEQPFVFRAEALGHPLIPEQEKVCNDFSLAELGEIVLITGSNMAGKSTFLRTIGVNLALAYAGGAVNARAFQTILFRLFTCIRVSDSVTDGTSYFYAEVKRLKALLSALEADHPLPLFFYIDEIYRGTNNQERLIGSRAYIRRLAGKHGVGLVATHDLELTRLAGQIAKVRNYHFRDDFRQGQMVFDYRLYPGPCPTTNALKIMEQAGLPV